MEVLTTRPYLQRLDSACLVRLPAPEARLVSAAQTARMGNAVSPVSLQSIARLENTATLVRPGCLQRGVVSYDFPIRVKYRLK